mmetsp:Transcript_15012/g.31081  ORF Transcript_15012/g.31081 Transcript_15012/m.31081 type:complete len:106 (+) Transcript_15012:871-1188(+)
MERCCCLVDLVDCATLNGIERVPEASTVVISEHKANGAERIGNNSENGFAELQLKRGNEIIRQSKACLLIVINLSIYLHRFSYNKSCCRQFFLPSAFCQLITARP